MSGNPKIDIKTINSFTKTPNNMVKSVGFDNEDEFNKFARDVVESGWNVDKNRCKLLTFEQQKNVNKTVFDKLTNYDVNLIKGGINQLNNDNEFSKFLKELFKPSELKLDFSIDVNDSKPTNGRFENLKPFYFKQNDMTKEPSNIEQLLKKTLNINGRGLNFGQFGGNFLPLSDGNNKNIQLGGASSCSERWELPLTTILTKLHNKGQLSVIEKNSIVNQFKIFKLNEKNLIEEINTLVDNAKSTMSISDNSFSPEKLSQTLEALGKTQRGMLNLFTGLLAGTSTASNIVSLGDIVTVGDNVTVDEGSM